MRFAVALIPLELACATSVPRPVAPPVAPIEIRAPIVPADAPAHAPAAPPADAPVNARGSEPSNSLPDLPPPATSPSDGIPEIAQRILFDDAAAKIAPPAFPVLDAIAAAIKMHPETFPIVALDGHAASNEPKPMRLSLARATAVRLALIERGVDGARLFERVSGATVPLCEHSREVCWERERRVEFAILRPAKSPAAGATPAERSAAEADHPTAAGAPCSNRRDVGVEEAGGCPTPKEGSPANSPTRPELLEQVTFARGSSVLTPSALPALDLVAGFLKANPTSLEIDGYAADGERGRTELARARAEAVRAYLIACGVNAGGLIVRSRGSEEPVCRERTSECKARNRRVELRFSDAHP